MNSGFPIKTRSIPVSVGTRLAQKLRKAWSSDHQMARTLDAVRYRLADGTVLYPQIRSYEDVTDRRVRNIKNNTYQEGQGVILELREEQTDELVGFSLFKLAVKEHDSRSFLGGIGVDSGSGQCAYKSMNCDSEIEVVEFYMENLGKHRHVGRILHFHSLAELFGIADYIDVTTECRWLVESLNKTGSYYCTPEPNSWRMLFQTHIISDGYGLLRDSEIEVINGRVLKSKYYRDDPKDALPEHYW